MEKEEKLESFTEYCKNYIVDHIWDYEGEEHYASDFAGIITQGPNADGTLTFSTYMAIQYLREWWYEAGMYWDWEQDNFGKNFHNPFDNPEAYMVCMVIEGCEYLLSRCKAIDEAWNDHITLDENTIKSILADIDDVYEIEF